MLDNIISKFTPETLDRLARMGIKIASIIVVALIIQWVVIYVIKRVARHSLDRSSKTKKKVPGRPKQAPRTPAEIKLERLRRESRIHTLSGVTKSATAILLWGWTFIAILAVLGVNVGPLLASAGVAGLAIGFGAKALIQDVISGIFMLLEEQYGVGDWIVVGDTEGTVESVSLRITTLRDIDGTVWYIRNGLITQLGNSTKSYAIARLEIPLGLSNDLDAAKEIILDTVTEASRSPELEELVLGDISVDGVSKVDVDHLTIRVCMRTVPGQQWHVNREMMARVLTAFAEHGITTPYPSGIGITPSSVTRSPGGMHRTDD